MKRFIVLLVALIMTFNIVSFTSYAQGNDIIINDMTEITPDECRKFTVDISNSIIKGDLETATKYKDCFDNSNNCASDFFEYIDNDVNNIGGTVYTIVVDWAFPQNSDTSDSVMFINFAVNKDNYYNILYLIEFHINSDGKIYGYNIWTY